MKKIITTFILIALFAINFASNAFAVGITVTTNAATSITSTAASISGSISTPVFSVTYWFEYGTTVSYGTTATPSPNSAPSPVNVTPSVNLSSLSPNTTYHYRLATNNGSSNFWSSDRTFTTTSGPPSTQALNISFANVASAQMDINWTNGNGASRAVFVKQGTGSITNPSDNTTYTASNNFASPGTQLGTSGYYCVYNSTGTTVTVTGLLPSTQYTVQVFEYNGGSGSEIYLTSTATNNPNSQSTSAVPIHFTATAGTLSGDYTTLKGVFDAINAGTLQGAITLTINANTTETASAVLNESGSGSASYTSINIYPTVAGLSITGNLAAPLIDFNGADNVTFDGRVNATGSSKDLVLSNTNTGYTDGNSTIRFKNGATYNTIKYCNVRGSSTDNYTITGTILFITAGSNTGNSYNLIDNNNITKAGANRASNTILSSGSSAFLNSNNTISNNNIYDFLNYTSTYNYSSFGIRLTDYNTDWTITGNNMYETTSLAPTSFISFYLIYITSNNVAGVNFTISNNNLGGSGPNCTGTWTKTASNGNEFHCIDMITGTSVASNIQGNLITNFTYSNTNGSMFHAIIFRDGNVNIGTSTGNVIGAATGTGAITLTNGANGGTMYAINVFGNGTSDVENNVIGSINVGNSNSTCGTGFVGIRNDMNTSTTSNNTVGSLTTANSIIASSASTGNSQTIFGISVTYTSGSKTVNNNTVTNITNATSNSTTSTQGQLIGITTSSGIATITNNTIRDLTIANANINLLNYASLIGIEMYYPANSASIVGNTIYNLSNTNTSFTGGVLGIYFNKGFSNGLTVSRNFIHDLSVSNSSTVANIYGIKIAEGSTTYSNNIISLGGNTPTNMYGIYESGSSAGNNLIYNTIYIAGSPTAGSNNSFALFSNSSSTSRDFRNNIFTNVRTNNGATGSHYAAYFNYAVNSNLTLNYNDYYVNVAGGGVLGYYNGSNVTTLPLVTAKDALSKNINPAFANAGGTTAANYLPSETTLVGGLGTGITTDFAGSVTRSATLPAMGAWEYVVSNCVSPSIGSQSTATQTICLNGSYSSISVTANGSGLSYQWYSNTVSNTSGGSTIGTNSNSFTPSAGTSGTLYYYCVVTGTCGTATSAVSGAFVTNAIPNVGTSVSPSASVCSGTSVTLNGTGAASYNWTGGVTDATPFTAVANATYTVTGTTNGCSSTATQTITVTTASICQNGGTVNASCGCDCPPGFTGSLCQTIVGCTNAPPAPTIAGPNAVCQLTAALYTATTTDAVTYTWTTPSGMTIASGQNTASLNVAIAPGTVIGNVTCSATNACGTSAVTNYMITKKPQTPSTISGPTSVCGLTTAQYSIPITFGALSYLWTVPNGMTIISGSSTRMIIVAFATNFVGGAITVTAVNNCGYVPGTSLKVYGKSAPSSITGPSNVCGSTTATYTCSTVPNATSYYWTIPSAWSIVSGQNTNTIVVHLPANVNSINYAGSVRVQAISACGTSNFNTITVNYCKALQTANTSEVDNNFMSIYPNPANTEFTISLNINQSNLELEIYDVLGNKVINKILTNQTSTINIEQLSNGLYFVRLLDANSNIIYTQRLVKE